MQCPPQWRNRFHSRHSPYSYPCPAHKRPALRSLQALLRRLRSFPLPPPSLLPACAFRPRIPAARRQALFPRPQACLPALPAPFPSQKASASPRPAAPVLPQAALPLLPALPASAKALPPALPVPQAAPPKHSAAPVNQMPASAHSPAKNRSPACLRPAKNRRPAPLRSPPEAAPFLPRSVKVPLPAPRARRKAPAGSGQAPPAGKKALLSHPRSALCRLQALPCRPLTLPARRKAPALPPQALPLPPPFPPSASFWHRRSLPAHPK